MVSTFGPSVMSHPMVSYSIMQGCLSKSQARSQRLQGTGIFCALFLLSSKQSHEVGKRIQLFQMRKSRLNKLWIQAQHELTVMGQSQGHMKSVCSQSWMHSLPEAPPLSKQPGSKISEMTRKEIAATGPPTINWQSWRNYLASCPGLVYEMEF